VLTCVVFSQRRGTIADSGLFFGSVHGPLCASRRLLAIQILALAVPFSLPAQSSTARSDGNKSDSRTAGDFSQEPAIYDYVHVSMRYENDGSGSSEVHGRIRIQTPAGLTAGGQLVFEYNAADEQEEIRSVQVLKPDGSVVTAGPEAVQDLSAPVTREAPIYTDARQKHVTVPGVSVGDVVEFDVVKTAKPLLHGQFWQIWNFERRMIALDEQLDLNVPASRALKIKSPEGIEPSTHVEADRRFYHWATSNLKAAPPIDIFKDFKFDVTKLLEGARPTPAPRLIFSTFQSWAEVSDWYAELERERRPATPEIRAMAHEITHGQKTDQDKAEALYYWVSKNIRYVSLSFGAGRYQPHPAADVLTNRYGDCKDKTTLLEAMLEAEGLHAQAVLANLNADVDPDAPNPLQFDHVYTFLRLGDQDRWLDTTVGVAPFGYLAPQLRGKEALIVTAEASAGLRKTPEALPMTVEYRVGVDGIVDADGKLDATVELETRGDLEVLIRILNDHVSQEQLEKSADSVLMRTNKFFFDSVRYTDFRVVNASDVSHPVKARFHIIGTMKWGNPKKNTRAQMTAAFTDVPILQWHLLSLLPQVDSRHDASSKLEPLGVDLKGPKLDSFSINFAFASLVKSDVPPANNFRIETKFALFESSDEWKENTFRASRSLTLRVPSIQPGDAKEYANFVQKVSEATALPTPARNDGGAVVTDATTKPNTVPSSSPRAAPKSDSGKPAYVPSAETQDLYKRGMDEVKRRNWGNAIEAFETAVKADPQYPDAWRELGRAHMYARQYPDAEAAFRKYLAVAPDDQPAYWNLAWALFNEKKYEEEADFLVKRIEVAPNDGDALYRLGTVYLALHKPEQAVPVLERSVVRYPKYVNAHYSLGRAYLETHQDDRAVQSFRRVLTLDDSESMLNSVAYTLVENNSSLDIAEEWSQRSIGVVETELNNTSLSNVASQTWALVVKLGQDWDTMGWIKFQQGKTDAAQKYVLAAWQIADDLAIDMHLGRVYEAQGHKDQAIQMYLAALSVTRPDRSLDDDAKEARTRLAGVLGGDSLVDDQLAQFRKNKPTMRGVSIANPAGVQGIGQYTVIIDADSKVVDLAAMGADDGLAGLADSIRAAAMPQSFPDSTLKKLPRLSTLVCSAANQPCTLTLLPASAASHLLPTD
jgi:tetratricopeptide (TPR) repeat protein